MEKLVSVVVPVYNVQDYLDRCVESIVNQTYKSLEIILVDDGSPDNCPKMCDEWAKKDSRIKVIHKENAGLGEARNTGLGYATGEFIIFLDSDDYIDTATVEKSMSSAQKYSSDVVIFGRQDVNDEGVTGQLNICSPVEFFSGESVQKEILPATFSYKMGFGVSAVCRMYRMSVFRDYNLRFRSEREIISEDAFFALELFSKDISVSIVKDNLYNYYCRTTSLTHTYRDDRQEKNDSFIRQCLELAKKEGLSQEVLSHLKVRYHMYTITTLKQIVSSDLPDKEKKKKVWEVFNNPTLSGTLSKNVLSLEKLLSKVFFSLVKIKGYGVAYLLLKTKVSKGK